MTNIKNSEPAVIADMEFLINNSQINIRNLFISRNTYERLKQFAKISKTACSILQKIDTANIVDYKETETKSKILVLNDADNNTIKIYNMLKQQHKDVRIGTISFKLLRYCERNNIPTFDIVISKEKEEYER